jgi:hypothetical protein
MKSCKPSMKYTRFQLGAPESKDPERATVMKLYQTHGPVDLERSAHDSRLGHKTDL